MLRAYRPIQSSLANEIILKDHYAAKMPNFVKLVYADVESESGSKVLACAIFSLPIGRSDLEALELTRLVRIPEYDHPLTKLISKAVGHIIKEKLADLLISYADSEESHHGGIYQACSWVYTGMRGERLDGFNIDGLFVPARTCNGRYGTSSAEELPKLLPKSKVEPHFDQGKHLYWKALTKAGMQKAVSYGFVSLPYPKPALTGTSNPPEVALSPNAVGSPLERSATRKGVIPIPGLEPPKRNPTRFTGVSGAIPIRVRAASSPGGIGKPWDRGRLDDGKVLESLRKLPLVPPQTLCVDTEMDLERMLAALERLKSRGEARRTFQGKWIAVEIEKA